MLPDGVVHRAFDDETLVLNLATGRYHGLNPTGARLLELLGELDGDVGAAIESLADECGVKPRAIRPELADFCARLLERGLLEVVPR